MRITVRASLGIAVFATSGSSFERTGPPQQTSGAMAGQPSAAARIWPPKRACRFFRPNLFSERLRRRQLIRGAGRLPLTDRTSAGQSVGSLLFRELRYGGIAEPTLACILLPPATELVAAMRPKEVATSGSHSVGFRPRRPTD